MVNFQPYFQYLVEICSGLHGPQKLMMVVIPAIASAFLLGVYSTRPSRKSLPPIAVAVSTTPSSTPTKQGKKPPMSSEELKNFLSSDLVPLEIINNILSLMPSEDLAKVGQVSRRFAALVSDGELWRNLLKTRWPEEDYSSHPSNNLQALYSKKAKIENERLGFTPGRFLLSVMQQCANFTSEEEHPKEGEGWWKARFVHEMHTSMQDSGITLIKEDEANGNSIMWLEHVQTKSRFGWIRFLDTRDARRKFAGGKYLNEQASSPFTGSIVGYINFDIYDTTTVQATTVREFVQTLLYETRGIISRTDSGYVRHSVHLKNVPLSELFAKDGMNDGDSYLDSDPQSQYMMALISSCRNLLDSNGLQHITVKYINSTHNPIRCSELTDKVVELDLPVWLFDFDVLKDKTLWNCIAF